MDRLKEFTFAKALGLGEQLTPSPDYSYRQEAERQSVDHGKSSQGFHSHRLFASAPQAGA
jgi:hypothetical protein